MKISKQIFEISDTVSISIINNKIYLMGIELTELELIELINQAQRAIEYKRNITNE